MSHRILRLLQELGEELQETRTNRSGGVVLSYQQPGRNDHVRVNSPEGYRQLAGGFFSPRFGFPQRVLVPDDNGRANLFAEPQKAVFWVSPEHKPYTAPTQSVGDVGYTGSKETEMPLINAGIERDRRKEDYNRFAQFITQIYRDV
jgi:hypothetical protein